MPQARDGSLRHPEGAFHIGEVVDLSAMFLLTGYTTTINASPPP